MRSTIYYFVSLLSNGPFSHTLICYTHCLRFERKKKEMREKEREQQKHGGIQLNVCTKDVILLHIAKTFQTEIQILSSAISSVRLMRFFCFKLFFRQFFFCSSVSRVFMSFCGVILMLLLLCSFVRCSQYLLSLRVACMCVSVFELFSLSNILSVWVVQFSSDVDAAYVCYCEHVCRCAKLPFIAGGPLLNWIPTEADEEKGTNARTHTQMPAQIFLYLEFSFIINM